MMTRGFKLKLIIFLLMGLQVSLLFWSSTRHSPTWDEPAHLAAGLFQWNFGCHQVYKVNPPLAHVVAGFPLFWQGIRCDWSIVSENPAIRSEFALGHRLESMNAAEFQNMVVVGRWMCIPIALLGAWTCYAWGAELYGTAAGLLSLSMWCFSPEILGHAQLVTTDVAATSFGVFAAYCFWRWCYRPILNRMLWAGLALGLALSAKSTWIVFIPLWLVLGSVCLANRSWRGQSRLQFGTECAQLAGIMVLGGYVLSALYGFDRCFQRLDSFPFVSNAFSAPSPETTDRNAQSRLNRFQGTMIGFVPVPLPADFIQGLTFKKDFERARKASYLRGEIRTKRLVVLLSVWSCNQDAGRDARSGDRRSFLGTSRAGILSTKCGAVGSSGPGASDCKHEYRHESSLTVCDACPSILFYSGKPSGSRSWRTGQDAANAGPDGDGLGGHKCSRGISARPVLLQ
ncbi:MAG: glycosyltransferase family 39 protein [Planctomycetales bacterium]